tara:strand:+ start:1106 stop:2056 length:951 start_codon:yes stop_codon:yes gene_type:complete
MALGTAHMTTTTHTKFIPELWSDEVIAAYKSNLVLANLVTKMNHNGKKGDTIHIPKPTRGSASAKAASTQVSLITATETELTVSIDKHYEYSRLIEDILDKQALSSMRTFYTDDAGYALAKLVDTHLWLQAYTLAGGTINAVSSGTTIDFGTAGTVIGSNGTTAFDAGADNAAALADAGIRQVIQTLDDNDIPMSDRFFVIPPVEKKNLTGLARFTEQAFVGEVGAGNSIRNGLVGDVYGIPVYVSTNCPLDTEGSQDARLCLMAHKSALVLAEQMSVRTQTQYKQEYLGDLFTADTIYGTGELRNDAGVKIAVIA